MIIALLTALFAYDYFISFAYLIIPEQNVTFAAPLMIFCYLNRP